MSDLADLDPMLVAIWTRQADEILTVGLGRVFNDADDAPGPEGFKRVLVARYNRAQRLLEAL